MSFDKDTKRNEFFSQMEKEVRACLDPSTGKPQASLVETTTCPACNCTGSPMFEKWGFTYERCDSCGLFFVNPRLNEKAVLDLYREDSIANKMWATQVHSSPTQQAVNSAYFREHATLLRKYLPAGKLLDVGCGNGDFLEIARDQGFDCHGIELERSALEICETKGLQVEPKLLDDSSLSPESYDAITMFGVLEHLYNPRKDMERVHSLLRKGGVALIITPNAYGLVGMLLRSEARFYTPRNHPVIFSFRSATRLMESLGFSILHMDTVLTGLDSIVNGAQLRPPFGSVATEDLPPAIARLLEDRERCERFLWELDLGLRLRFIARK